MRYLIVIVIFFSCNSDNRFESKIIRTDSISAATLNLTDSLTASIDALDSLKPEVKEAIAQLKYYKQLQNDYSKQEAEIIYKPITDSSAIIALRRKLAAANNEIARLNGELAVMSYRQKEIPAAAMRESIEPPVETPDENSITISLDGSSPKGDIPTTNLVIYLIPYSKKAKRLTRYEPYCPEELSGNEPAKYYNGVYFFNNVQPGKYVIKICTYYGNFRVINKTAGKYNIEMQVSPPIQ